MGLNFPSACSAGCKDFKISNDAKVTYQNCNCIKKKIDNTFGLSPGHPLITQSVGDLTATHGECSSNDESCYHSFYIFTAVVIILAFTKFSGQLGGLLVLLRAIEVEDKVTYLSRTRLENLIKIETIETIIKNPRVREIS